MTIQIVKGDSVIDAVWDSISKSWMYRFQVEWLDIQECGQVAGLFDIEGI